MNIAPIIDPTGGDSLLIVVTPRDLERLAGGRCLTFQAPTPELRELRLAFLAVTDEDTGNPVPSLPLVAVG